MEDYMKNYYVLLGLAILAGNVSADPTYKDYFCIAGSLAFALACSASLSYEHYKNRSDELHQQFIWDIQSNPENNVMRPSPSTFHINNRQNARLAREGIAIAIASFATTLIM